MSHFNHVMITGGVLLGVVYLLMFGLSSPITAAVPFMIAIIFMVREAKQAQTAAQEPVTDEAAES